MKQLFMAFAFVTLCQTHTDQAFGQDEFSGILLYKNVPCAQCEVSFENPGRPALPVLSDRDGRFVLMDPQPGTLILRVRKGELEFMEERIEIDEHFLDHPFVTLRPKPFHGSAASGHVQSITADLGQYPKEARNRYKDAQKFAKKGQSDEAIVKLEQAIHIAPDFYPGHILLGLLYASTGRLMDAEQEFEIARALDTSNPEPLINLSALYIQGRDPGRAIVVAEEAIKKDSGSARAFLNLGLALFHASHLQRARAALQRALSLAPGLEQARRALDEIER